MTAPVLIFGIGNEARGDDALGPLLLRRLSAWVASEGLSNRCELLEEYQLQVEHALDLSGRKLALFVDAGVDTTEPYAFHRALPCNAHTLYSHALTPEAVLSVYQKIHGEAPPAAFVLCIRGEQFGLGTPLSRAARQRMAQALEFVQALLKEAEEASWEGRCTARIVCT